MDFQVFRRVPNSNGVWWVKTKLKLINGEGIETFNSSLLNASLQKRNHTSIDRSTDLDQQAMELLLYVAKYLLLSASLALLLAASALADPAPLQDFCVANLFAAPDDAVNGFPCKPAASVTPDDFFFAGLSAPGNTSNALGSAVSSANVLSFPALNTLGLSMNRVDLAPGGLNAPHSHPRASELILVVEGRLLVGFVTTANRLFSRVVAAGENFVVPRGLVHFQYNVGETKAVAVTTFDSQLPGVVVAATTLFGAAPAIPDEVLAKAFQVDQQLVQMIKSKFQS